MLDLSLGTIKPGVDSSPVRGYTHHRILRAVAQGRGEGVRNKIASELHVSPATVTKSVALLIRIGLIESDEARPGPTGRPVVPLRLARKFVLIGIAITGSQGEPHTLHGAVIYLDGGTVDESDPVHEEELPPGAYKDPDAVIDAVVSFALKLKEFTPKDHVLGCGISIGGYVSATTGEIKRAFGAISHLGSTGTATLKNRVSDELELPVVLGNDITSLAMRSNLSPDQPAESYALLVPIDFGVGGALVMKGRAWLGAHEMASEPGHIPCPGIALVRRLPDDRPDAPDIMLPVPWCRCEMTVAGHSSCDPSDCVHQPAGHVEAYASPYGIQRRAVENGLASDDESLAGLARRPRSQREIGLLFYQAGVALATAAVPLIDWFDPERLLVYLPAELQDSGPDRVGSYYREGLRSEVEHTAFTDEAHRGHGASVLEIERLPVAELHRQLASSAAYLVFRRLLMVLTGEEPGDARDSAPSRGRNQPSDDELNHLPG